MSTLNGPHSLTDEAYREYQYVAEPFPKPLMTGLPIAGLVYRIDSPQKLWVGASGHRVLDATGIVHYMPFPVCNNQPVILRWKPKPGAEPVAF